MLIIFPLLIQIISAASCLLLWRRILAQRIITVVSSILLMICNFSLLNKVLNSGIQVMQVGGWPVPHGITLVVDLLSAIMLSMTGLAFFAVSIYTLGSIDERREAFGYYALFNALIMGICGSFLTGDIFNLYVWFEIILMASFVLLGLGGERKQLAASIKYVSLNLFGSILFLSAVALLYGLIGSLNIADIARKLIHTRPTQAFAISILFLVAFSIKAALFPFYSWLPDSYHTPPLAVTAIFAALLSKVGIYSLIRVFTTLFLENSDYTHPLIAILACITIVLGGWGAMSQWNFKKILSFHSVSQVGYIVLGLGIFTPLSLTASIYFMIHHMIVKTGLFFISGIIRRLYGTSRIKLLGDLFQIDKSLSILFLILAFSLMGIFPFSGFWAKYFLILSGYEEKQYLLTSIALISSIFTALSMIKVWNEVFWKPVDIEDSIKIQKPLKKIKKIALYFPAYLFALLSIIMTLWVSPFYEICSEAAEELLDSRNYIEAVLGANAY